MYKKLILKDAKKGAKLASAFDVAWRDYISCEDKEEAEKEKAVQETWKAFVEFVIEKPQSISDPLTLTQQKVGEIVKGFFTQTLTLLA